MWFLFADMKKGVEQLSSLTCKAQHFSLITKETAYPFEPAMLFGPGAGPEGWRHDGFSQVATGVRAPVPDEAACAEWLLERRWGSGFACPECGHGRFWRLGRKVLTLHGRACRRETSVTAGTVMHRSHLPLKVWFAPAWLVATHKNGMSARQLWLQLGLGSYKSAWLLLRKLRAAMVDPDRAPLAGLVEVDETSLPFRAGDTPARP